MHVQSCSLLIKLFFDVVVVVVALISSLFIARSARATTVFQKYHSNL